MGVFLILENPLEEWLIQVSYNISDDFLRDEHHDFIPAGYVCLFVQIHWFKSEQKLVGGLAHLFNFHIYGMSSFPLTNSYFSRWLSHHQPEKI